MHTFLKYMQLEKDTEKVLYLQKSVTNCGDLSLKCRRRPVLCLHSQFKKEKTKLGIQPFIRFWSTVSQKSQAYSK
jgi:hypothetical protein